MIRPKTRYIFIALCSVLILGCSAPPQSAQRTASPPQKNTMPSGAQKGYQQVMASQTIGGRKLAPDGRVTAFVVFASWCGHCKHELAQLSEIRKTYPSLRIIGVNAYEEFQGLSDREKLKQYVETNAPWLTEIVSADATMLDDFGKIPKIPTMFLYDRQGVVVAEYRRNKRPAPSNEELSAAIESAMQR